ncbi:unnamed protein product [Withania somnifera]
MDCVFTWDYNSLINELIQGMEHTKQLRTYLKSVASTSETTPDLILQKILSAYEQSLLILKWTGSTVQSQRPAVAIKSMVPCDGSPTSDDKQRNFKDHQELIHISKRRKSQLTELVRVSTESGFEVPLDDGYSWRKYGHKDILGANFPRGYYRSTFRVIANCLATKVVQTYNSYHTCQCHQVTNSTRQATLPENQTNYQSLIGGGYSPYFVRAECGDSFEGPIDDGHSWRKYGQKDILGAKYPRSYYRCTNRHMQNCWATKQVQRSDDDPTVFEITYKDSHTCYLPTTSALQETSPEKEASQHSLIIGGYSPSFVSPTTPESNYFVHNLDHSESYLSDIGLFLDLHHSDSERTDTFSANTSTTSSSIGGEFARSYGARLDIPKPKIILPKRMIWTNSLDLITKLLRN